MDPIPARLSWRFHLASLALLLLSSAGAALGVGLGSLFVGGMLTDPIYYNPFNAARLTVFILGAVVGVATLWWIYLHLARHACQPANRRRRLAGLACGMITGLFLLEQAETWTVRFAVALVMLGAIWLARIRRDT
ncbi:hypothetical protein [Pseudomonas sp. TE3610]